MSARASPQKDDQNANLDDDEYEEDDDSLIPPDFAISIDPIHFTTEEYELEKLHGKWLYKIKYPPKENSMFLTAYQGGQLQPATYRYLYVANKAFDLIHPALAKCAFYNRNKQQVFYEFPQDSTIVHFDNYFHSITPLQQQTILFGVSTAIFYLFSKGFAIPNFSLDDIIIVDHLPFLINYVNANNVEFDQKSRTFRSTLSERTISKQLSLVINRIISRNPNFGENDLPPNGLNNQLTELLNANLNSDKFTELFKFAEFFSKQSFKNNISTCDEYNAYGHILENANFIDFSPFLQYDITVYAALRNTKDEIMENQEKAKDENPLYRSLLFGSLNNLPLYLSRFMGVFKEPFHFPLLNRVPENIIKNLIQFRPTTNRVMFELLCFERPELLVITIDGNQNAVQPISFFQNAVDKYGFYSQCMKEASQAYHNPLMAEANRIRPFHPIAYKYLKESAKEGYPKAKLDLASHYIRGDIAPMNFEKAFKILSDPEFQNDHQVQYYLSQAKEAYQKIENEIANLTGENRNLYDRAVNDNDLLSIVFCAYNFYTGFNGFPQSPSHSVAFYRKAARLSPDYMCLLGGLYLRGYVFPRNIKRAQNCFRRAAIGTRYDNNPSESLPGGCFKAKILDGMLRKHVWRLYLSNVSVRDDSDYSDNNDNNDNYDSANDSDIHNNLDIFDIYDNYMQSTTSMSFDDSMIFPTAVFLAESTQIKSLYNAPIMKSYYYYDTRNDYNIVKKNEIKFALCSNYYNIEPTPDEYHHVRTIASILKSLLDANILPHDFISNELTEEDDEFEDEIDKEIKKYDEEHPYEDLYYEDVSQNNDSISAKKVRNARLQNLKRLRIVSDPTDIDLFENRPSDSDKSFFRISYLPNNQISDYDSNISFLYEKLIKLIESCNKGKKDHQRIYSQLLYNRNPKDTNPLYTLLKDILATPNPSEETKLEKRSSSILSLKKSQYDLSIPKLPTISDQDKFGKLNSGRNQDFVRFNDSAITDDPNEPLYSVPIGVSKELDALEEQSDPELYLKVANSYYNGINGYPINYNKAARYYLKAAILGNSEAQWKFAQMSVNGLGVNQNSKSAAEYFEKSANQGDPEGMLRYALFIRHILLNHRTSPNFPLPSFQELLEKSAAQGNIEAIHQIGISLEANYSRSDGIVKSIPKYEEAAAKGHVPSLVRLIQALDSYIKTLQHNDDDDLTSSRSHIDIENCKDLYSQYTKKYEKYLYYSLGLFDHDMAFRTIEFLNKSGKYDQAQIIIENGLSIEPSLYIPYQAERIALFSDTSDSHRFPLAKKMLGPFIKSYYEYSNRKQSNKKLKIPQEHQYIIKKGYIEKYVMVYVKILTEEREFLQAVNLLVKCKKCLTIKSKDDFLQCYKTIKCNDEGSQILREKQISISFYLHEYRDCTDALIALRSNKYRKYIAGYHKLKAILDQNENNQFALLKLGQIYLKGGKFYYVWRNVPKALEYIQKAALQDCPEARVTYGKILLYGFYCEPNPQKAYNYFMKAFEESNRDPRSAYFLSKKIFRKTEGGNNTNYSFVTEEQAERYLDIACDFGYRRAYFTRGRKLVKADENSREGWQLIEQAVNQNYKKAKKFVKAHKNPYKPSKCRDDSTGEGSVDEV